MRRASTLLLLLLTAAAASTVGARFFLREAQAAPQPAGAVRGTLTKVSAVDGRIERIRVRGEDGEQTYELDSGTVVRARGRDASPRDLAPGDTVAVRYRSDGDRRVAVEIEIARG